MRVAAARDAHLWDEALREQIYLGDEAFVDRMQKIADPQRTSAREIPKAQHRTSRSLAQWLSTCDSREEALFRAHTQSGLTMSALAEELGLPCQSSDCAGGGGKGKT
jgi:putative transposase